MATIGLCLISKANDENVQRLINQYKQYFDEIYIQINGGGVLPDPEPQVHVSSYKWHDDFGAARNALLKLVKTDYWMWIDTDNYIDHPERIGALIDSANKAKIDQIYLPYVYLTDKDGNIKGAAIRERIFKRSHPFKWVDPVHETVISKSNPKNASVHEVIVRQDNKTKSILAASVKRDLKILKKQYSSGDRSVKTLFYLANCYYSLKNFTKAIKFYSQVTKATDDEEIIYAAWMGLAQSKQEIGKTTEAYKHYRAAIKYQPELSDAYLYMGKTYLAARQYQQAAKWLSKGLTKTPFVGRRPIDPTALSTDTLVELAIAYVHTGEFGKANKTMEEVTSMGSNEPGLRKIHDELINAQREKYGLSSYTYTADTK